MTILLCHNAYQRRGGEDQVFDDEWQLLESHGHKIVHFRQHNDQINGMTWPGVAARTVWNPRAFKDVRALIRLHRPAVMHCTNTFPLMSPSVYYAARAEGVPVIQSLHNYRMVCPAATFFRNGQVCEQCVGKTIPWPAVVHECYWHGRASNAVVTAMLTVHRMLRTWSRLVDLYIVPTAFAHRKLVEGGLPEAKIVRKPNFIHGDPGPGTGAGGYAAFVGRLSPEKGVDTLLDAWSRLAAPIRLKIVGDGPLTELVAKAAAIDSRIEHLGWRPVTDVYDIVGNAACLIVPSMTYEVMPKTILEAFARGTPAIVSNHGALSELVEPDRTGAVFAPGDAADLAAMVGRLLTDPYHLANLRRLVRVEFEQKYTAEENYRLLMDIYGRASGQDVEALREPSERRVPGPLIPVAPAGTPRRSPS